MMKHVKAFVGGVAPLVVLKTAKYGYHHALEDGMPLLAVGILIVLIALTIVYVDFVMKGGE